MKKNSDFPSPLSIQPTGTVIVKIGVWEIRCPFNDTTTITREDNEARMLVCYKNELEDLSAAAKMAYEEAKRQTPVRSPRCEECGRMMTNEEWNRWFHGYTMVIGVTFHCGCDGTESWMEVKPNDRPHFEVGRQS
jgi:hypothetical protein